MKGNKIILEKLNKDELKILTALFNFVIPSCSEKKTPSAGILCEAENAFSDQDIVLFKEVVAQIDNIADTIKGKVFVELSKEEVILTINHLKKQSARDYNNFVFRIVNYYYTNNKVLEAIGIQSSPPFPDGNFVIEGDLLLFEKVYLKGEVYRKFPPNIEQI